MVCWAGVDVSAYTPGPGGIDYARSQVETYKTSDANNYYYTGNFFMQSYSSSARNGGYSNTVYYEAGWGKWADAVPGQVQNSMYNPQVVAGRANLGDPASEFGWVTTGTRWNGARTYTASGVVGDSGVRYVRPAQTDYRRSKTTPESKGVIAQTGGLVIGNDYWVKPNTTLTIRIDGYQDWAGTDSLHILDDYVSANWLRLVASGVEAKAYISRDGTFANNMTSPHFTISKNSSSVSGVKTLVTTFNVTSTVDNAAYSITSYSASANGKAHGYIDTGKDIRTDGTAPNNPVITLSNAGWSNGTVTATLSHGADAGVGVERSEYRINGGAWTTYTSQLSYSDSTKIEGRTIDKLGNVSGITTSNISIDKTAPTITFGTNGDTTYTATGTTVTVADVGGSGVATRQYAWSTSTVTPTFSTTFVSGATLTTPSISGTHYLHIRATDAAGNVTTTRSNGFNVDKTAPTGTVSLSPSSWTNSSVTITLNATDTGGSGVKQVRVSGGSWIAGSTTQRTVSGNGTYSFEIMDNAGNTATVSATVSNMDKTKPSGNYSPASGGWVKTDLVTRFTPSDNTGIGGSGVKQYIWAHKKDGVQVASGTVIGGGYKDFTFVEDGVHTVEVTVTDNAGNTQLVKSGEFKIDKTAPVGSVGYGYNEVDSMVTLTPTGVKDSVAKSANVSGLNRWVTTVTAKNTAGTVVGTPHVITTSDYVTPLKINVHTQFSGQADKIEVRSVVYDEVGNEYVIFTNAQDIYYMRASVNRALSTVVENAAINTSKIVKARGGELLRVKIEAFGNPDKVVVEGKGIGDNVGKVLNNFNYEILNTHATITNVARVHGLYSDDFTKAKDVFVDVYQDPGNYIITISAYKGAGLVQKREILYTVEVGSEATTATLRTRLFYKMPDK